MSSRCSCKVGRVVANILERNSVTIAERRLKHLDEDRDTTKLCAAYKKRYDQSTVEQRCKVPEESCDDDNTTVCDPLECKIRKVELPGPIDSFGETDPHRSCIPFEVDDGETRVSACEAGEIRRCVKKEPENKHLCKAEPPSCGPNPKLYPLEHAKDKPTLHGGVKSGEKWKKEYEYNTCD